MKTIISFISRMFFFVSITVTCLTGFVNADNQSKSTNNKINTTTSMMIFGDVDSDGIIDLTDFFIVFNDCNNFVTGNPITDLSGDGFTNLSDVLIVYNLL